MDVQSAASLPGAVDPGKTNRNEKGLANFNPHARPNEGR